MTEPSEALLPSEELMRSYLQEVVADGRLDLIEAMTQPDMVDEANQAFGGPPGRAGLTAHVKGFRRNIGDLSVVIESVVGNDDTVVGWWSFTGLHLGPWLDRPPTGEPIEGTVISQFTLVDGLVSRYRVWVHAQFDEGVVFDPRRERSA
jgi:predicted ester cyclase